MVHRKGAKRQSWDSARTTGRPSHLPRPRHSVDCAADPWSIDVERAGSEAGAAEAPARAGSADRGRLPAAATCLAVRCHGHHVRARGLLGVEWRHPRGGISRGIRTRQSPGRHHHRRPRGGPAVSSRKLPRAGTYWCRWNGHGGAGAARGGGLGPAAGGATWPSS